VQNIKEKVLSALRWTVIGRFTSQLLTWGITLVVIRLLQPADYGLMAMSEVVFSLLMVLSSAGLGSALIQAKDVNDRQIRQMFGMLLVVNVALFAVLFLGAPLIGAYYQKPRVTLISQVLSIGFLLIPFITIPSALLSREIDFKRKSIVELLASIVATVTILVLAALGAGVWSLVVGRLLNLALRAVGLNLVRPSLKAPVFSFKAARHLLEFGGIYTLTSILWLLYSQADVVIAGPHLSEKVMGFYAVAIHLAGLVVIKVMPLLNQVALPAYSRLQHDPSAVGYYFLKVVRIVALLSFPFFLGLATIAPEFVRLILGERYEGAILSLTLLSLLMPVRMISNLFPSVVFAMGRPRLELGNTLFGLLVMPVAFFIGVRWGLLGLCVGWLIGQPLVFAFQLYRNCALVRITKRDVLEAMWPALAASVLMALAVVALKQLPLDLLGRPAELVLLILAGACVYGGVVWTLHRDRALEVFSAARSG
jgi:O-antigen/teichoic acid export membrane protein